MARENHFKLAEIEKRGERKREKRERKKKEGREDRRQDHVVKE